MQVPVQMAPDSIYRTMEGLGIWEHRGNVAAVGIGVSPTARRWDESPETSVGAWTILAMRRAMEDAGVSPDQVDGLVLTPDTSTGNTWPANQVIPADVVAAFQQTAAGAAFQKVVAAAALKVVVARVPEQIVVVVRADEVLDAFQCVSLGVTTGPGPS